MISCARLRSSWCWRSGELLDGTYLLSNFLASDSLLSRLRVSEALEDASLAVDLGRQYRAGALLPSPDWRRVADADLVVRDALNNTLATSSFVALVTVSDHFCDLSRATEHLTGDSLAGHNAHLLTLLDDEIAPDFLRSGDAVVTGVSYNPPGLTTVTYDRRDNNRIGLHLDSWESNSIRERSNARNRISVNIGSGPRHLLFMSSGVDIVYRRVGLHEPNNDLFKQLFAATRFLRHSVYSLEVRPNEAYIAPTECLVHDGSTRWSSHTDRSMTIRARLLPRLAAPNAI